MRHGRRRRRLLPTCLIVLLTTGGALPTAARSVAAPAAATRSTASVEDAARYPCPQYGQFAATNPYEEVMADRFRWAPYRAVTVGNGRGNITWTLDPYRQESWRTWLHSLLWTGQIIRYGASSYDAYRRPEGLDRAVVIARDWVADNPYPWPTGPGAGNATMNRTGVLLCLREGLIAMGKGAPAWLDTALVQHATYLRDHTWPDHNVGTEQTISMMGVGCVLQRRDFRDLGATRLSQRISRVIDAQGANNEQSVNYADVNAKLWDRAAEAMRTCGIDSPAARTILTRRALAGVFLDHATAPDGTYHRLGDTPTRRPEATDSATQQWIRSDGAAGTPPANRVAVYGAGFVFGRSGWGPGSRKPSQESAYTLRFGPIRSGHGHNDHTSLTWTTRGRDILVDPGVGSYNNDAWREYYTGQSAHNQVVVAGTRYSQPTRLLSSTVRPGADAYVLADAPRKGAARSRAVLFLTDPDLVVVSDKVTSTTPATFTQHWHLRPDQVLTVTGARATAHARGDATATTLLQLPPPGGQPAPFAKTSGSTRPIQGWFWPTPFRKVPAPVASSTKTGTSATFVTAVVAARARAAVTATASPGGGGSTLYRFTVDGAPVTVALSAGGALSRVG